MNNDEFDTMEEVEEALYELIDLGLVEAYGVDEDGSFIYKLTDKGGEIEEEG
jgi:predicted transcriptional regulator with HTH domain